jgi:hypothetical protein
VQGISLFVFPGGSLDIYKSNNMLQQHAATTTATATITTTTTNDSRINVQTSVPTNMINALAREAKGSAMVSVPLEVR